MEMIVKFQENGIGKEVEEKRFSSDDVDFLSFAEDFGSQSPGFKSVSNLQKMKEIVEKFNNSSNQAELVIYFKSHFPISELRIKRTINGFSRLERN